MQKQFLALFKRIKENQENPIFSPLGLETLLSLLAEGTKGETRQALYKILELSPASNALENLLERLKFIEENRSTPLLESTNTIYYSPPLLNPVADFIEKVKASLELTLKPKLLGKKEMAFIVENKLNIKTFWLQHFDTVPHKTEFFTLANGEEVETLFINQSNIFGKNKTRYLKKDNFHAIQIPFIEKGLCAEIYLPFEKDGLADFVQKINTTDFKKWGTQFQEVERMDIYLPKFEVEFKADFSSILKQLGLDKLFQPSWDFTALFKSKEPLFIQKIKQDNFFKLNEHGIEAGSTSRGYGGITGTRRIDKFILFEATHPFLYLIRDKSTDTILFMGLFEVPDRQQNFSLSYYNLAELKKFNNDSIPFSHRFCFATTAYALESLTAHFKFNNDFVNDYIKGIWDLAEKNNVSKLKEDLKKYEALAWPVSFEEMRPGTKLSKDKNHIKNTPRQIVSMFYEFQGKVVSSLLNDNHVDVDFLGWLVKFNLFVLNNINAKIPVWENCRKYRRLVDNPWGNSIARIDFLSFLEQPIPESSLNANQIRERQQNKIIRNLQPKLFDITFRGKVYIGLICLDKMLEKEAVYPIELKGWLIDLVDFIANEKSTKFDLLVLLRFDMFNQTGYFDENQYFTKDGLDNFKTKYPYLVTILDGLDGILNSYKYLKKGDDFDFSYRCIMNFLKALGKHKITLPDQLLFEQFPIKEADILGEPIKLDKKSLKNCFKIIE